MGEEIGFYCQSLNSTQVVLKPQLNYEMIAMPGKDPKLKDLVSDSPSIIYTKGIENKKICEWNLPSKWAIDSKYGGVPKPGSNTDPKSDPIWKMDLMNGKEYFVIIFAGNNHKEEIAWYTKVTGAHKDDVFSRKAYDSYVRGAAGGDVINKSEMNLKPIEVLCLLVFIRYIYE
jgi:hypothetical protein